MRVKVVRNNKTTQYFTNFYNEARKLSLTMSVLMLFGYIFIPLLFALTRENKNQSTLTGIFIIIGIVFTILFLLHLKDFLFANKRKNMEIIFNFDEATFQLEEKVFKLGNFKIENGFQTVYSKRKDFTEIYVFDENNKKVVFKFKMFPVEAREFIKDAMYDKVFISRHGHYANPRNINPFRSNDVSLSEEGIRQIEDNADYLKDKNISAIFSSPIQRCKESAEIYSKVLDLPINFTDSLIEVDSPYQNMSNEKYDKEFSGSSLYSNEYHLLNGGETSEQIIKRTTNFLNKILDEYRGKNVLFVSHGDPIMLLFATVTGKKLDYSKKIEKQMIYIPKGKMIELDYQNKRFAQSRYIDF